MLTRFQPLRRDMLVVCEALLPPAVNVLKWVTFAHTVRGSVVVILPLKPVSFSGTQLLPLYQYIQRLLSFMLAAVSSAAVYCIEIMAH